MTISELVMIILFVIFMVALWTYSIYVYSYLEKDKDPPINIFGLYSRKQWLKIKDPERREDRRKYIIGKIYGARFLIPYGVIVYILAFIFRKN